jgi:hypothetical protein
MKFPAFLHAVVHIVLDSNWKVPNLKTKATRLLATIPIYSSQAHKYCKQLCHIDFYSIVLEALNKDKTSYKKLVQYLIEQDFKSYKAYCMSLINSVVNVPVVVGERAKLRDNFLQLGITEKIDVRYSKQKLMLHRNFEALRTRSCEYN